MKNQKLKWNGKAYSWNPEITRYEKIPLSFLWFPVVIATIGTISVGYAVANGSHKSVNRNTDNEKSFLVSRTQSPCRQTSRGHYDCNTPEELAYYEEKYGKEAIVTAYTSTPLQTDSTPCRSADGSDICLLESEDEHTCAANLYPFGTTLYIRGFGHCVVRDRMARRFSQTRVDLYFGGKDRNNAARTWGKRTEKVIVME